MTMVFFRGIRPEHAPSSVVSGWMSRPAGRGRQEPFHGSRLALLREWWRRHRSRTLLSQLNSHMLRDIGLSHAEAEYEANKPFWLP